MRSKRIRQRLERLERFIERPAAPAPAAPQAPADESRDLARELGASFARMIRGTGRNTA
jgi:hypothetical protein